SRDRAEKVATPFTAATVFVPLKVPEEGFVPIASVTEAEEEVTTLPFASRTPTLTAGGIADAEDEGTAWQCASRTPTWTAGVIAEPEAAFDGCTLKASLFAEPGVMLKEL